MPYKDDELRRMSLCILHAAMRTIESCLTQMLLNEYLRDRLGLRKLLKAVKKMYAELNRQIFRENAKVYVMEKSKIRAGITTWYDWQMYSIFTVMFDEFESLRLV